jgi:hypothetical protein
MQVMAVMRKDNACTAAAGKCLTLLLRTSWWHWCKVTACTAAAAAAGKCLTLLLHATCGSGARILPALLLLLLLAVT